MLDKFKNWLKDRLALQTEVVCIRSDCVNRRCDGFACKYKQIVIGEDGKCMEFIKKEAKQK